MLTLKQKREDFWGLSNDNVAIQGLFLLSQQRFQLNRRNTLLDEEKENIEQLKG